MTNASVSQFYVEVDYGAEGSANLFPLIGSGIATPSSHGIGIITLLIGEGTIINETRVGNAFLPTITGSGVALSGTVASDIAKLPLLASHGVGYSNYLGSGSMVLIPLEGNGIALSGLIVSGAGELPVLTGTGHELYDRRGTGTAALHLLFSSGYGRVIALPVCSTVLLNRKVIVMHLFSHAVSHYTNFNFNSLCHFKEHFLGANEQGIFILGGKNDLGQPIQADIRTGIHDFAKDGVLTLPKEAWLAYRTDGQLELNIEVEEGESYPYIFDETHSERIAEVRETLGKGLRERFYTFGIKNIDGSDFDIESFRILGDVIKRKRR